MNETPLFAGPLFGLRFWRVTADDRGEWLSAPHQNTRWPPGGGWLEATCPAGHAAPARGCDCGAHAWHPRRATARDVLAVRGTVPGIIEAEGAIEVHEDGLRAARARPYALIATPGCNRARVDRLAERYATSVIEVAGPRALLAWCRENGIGIDEDVVADLLDTGAGVERRRARLRARAKIAARVVAAFAVAAMLVVLGLRAGFGETADHSLYGRSGEVKVP